MHTPHEPLAPDHPAVESLAREVLEREERLSAYTYSIPLAAQASWDATRSEQVKSAPDLARAVARVAALADQLDREASEYLGRPVHSQAGDRIRAALNGDPS